MLTAESEDNYCPEFAPVDEDQHVWCNCMNEYGHVRLSATQEECLRTEGLTDEQHAAYEAAGIDVVNYECQCCTCQAMIYGVPKVGNPGKSCDSGSTDPDNHGCGDSAYYMFAAACCLLCLAVVFRKLQQKNEADASKKQAAEKKQNNGKRKKELKKGLSSDDNYKQNPL
jgi:hypothetical protein